MAAALTQSTLLGHARSPCVRRSDRGAEIARDDRGILRIGTRIVGWALETVQGRRRGQPQSAAPSGPGAVGDPGQQCL